jgi:hypothetical protein
MIRMKTRVRGAQFSYEKTADGDVRIEYGRGRRKVITAEDLQRLLRRFRGSQDRPPAGSVGAWLQQNATKVAIASYIGPILVHEGYATWVDNSTLQFSG